MDCIQLPTIKSVNSVSSSFRVLFALGAVAQRVVLVVHLRQQRAAVGRVLLRRDQLVAVVVQVIPGLGAGALPASFFGMFGRDRLALPRDLPIEAQKSL